MARLIVLGGYLGAGKTTLLNRLLADNHGLRIAVVVNDFGAIDIDAALITSQDGEMMEFANGCICCQLRDAATPLMLDLAARTDLDVVLVELSGVAMPSSFTSWGQVPGLQPGPAVVLADAQAIRRQLADEFIGDVVAAQLAQADVLAITKHESLPEAALTQVRSAVSQAAPKARVMLLPADQPQLLTDYQDPQAPGSGTHTAPEHTDDRFESHAVSGNTISDLPELQSVLTAGAALFERIKGVVCTADGTRYVVQATGDTVHIEAAAQTTEQPANSSELVFIAVRAQPAAPRAAVIEQVAALMQV